MASARDVVAKICICDGERLKGVSLNDLANAFRSGEPLATLRPLLNHDDPEVVVGGAWIASEVVDRTRGRVILEDLSSLLVHPDPAVRFWAVAAVADCATPSDVRALVSLLSRLADSSSVVRGQALRYWCVIPDSVVRGMSAVPAWTGARLLTSDAAFVDRLAAATSTEDWVRHAAIAGVARYDSGRPALLQEFKSLLSEDEATELERLVDWKNIQI